MFSKQSNFSRSVTHVIIVLIQYKDTNYMQSLILQTFLIHCYSKRTLKCAITLFLTPRAERVMHSMLELRTYLHQE